MILLLLNCCLCCLNRTLFPNQIFHINLPYHINTPLPMKKSSFHLRVHSVSYKLQDISWAQIQTVRVYYITYLRNQFINLQDRATMMGVREKARCSHIFMFCELRKTYKHQNGDIISFLFQRCKRRNAQKRTNKTVTKCILRAHRAHISQQWVYLSHVSSVYCVQTSLQCASYVKVRLSNYMVIHVKCRTFVLTWGCWWRKLRQT